MSKNIFVQLFILSISYKMSNLKKYIFNIFITKNYNKKIFKSLIVKHPVGLADLLAMLAT
mgnify:CR=1 FL=1